LTSDSAGAAKNPITATMRAAAVAAPRKLSLADVTIPEPGPDEVRVRIEGCGVCASNLPLWEGQPWFKYPTPPGSGGHEAWGTIERTGRDVTGIKEGDRVAVLSYNAYAEYDIASKDGVVVLPRPLHDKPFPGEPLGCAMNIFARGDIQAGRSVAIIGIGFLGALLTALCSRAGARVIAISRRQFALDMAHEFGATETIPMADHDRIVEEVRTLTNGEGCDRVIEAVGKQWPLDLAAELTRARGRLIIAGYHQDGPRQVNMQLWNWRGLDVINAHERDPKVYVQGIRAAVDLVASGDLDPSPLYTHTFKLEQLADAFEATNNRPDGFMKALVNVV
jgi:threonine dehydrogenase-like Zn-dependent dehydrogenase